VRNVARKVARQSPDVTDKEAADKESAFLAKPQEIAEGLQKTGPPDRDPAAGIKGDSEKYRIVERTASPDGRFAVALGFTDKKIDWEDYKDESRPGSYFDNDLYEDESLLNYVVDLRTRRILGKTGCRYFGTRPRYNHRECFVSWSLDSATFVQLTTDKWNYVACYAGRLATGPKLVGPVNVGKEAERSAFAFLAIHKNATYRKHGRQISIAISVSELTNDGVISLDVSGQVPKSFESDDSFSLTERIRLHITPAASCMETLDVRYGPKE
jgi:hypothetical protein